MTASGIASNGSSEIASSPAARSSSRRATRPAPLEELRAAGLDAFSELPLEAMPDAVIGLVSEAGFRRLRLTIESAPATERLGLFERASSLQAAHAMQSKR